MFRQTLNYWLLFAIETVGELIIIWQIVPPYRQLFGGETHGSGAPLDFIIWLLVGSVMVQTGYWLNRPLRIPERFGHHVLIGHLANFAGRLDMILVGGIFAATFIIRFDMVNPSIINAILLLFVLFSAYLYTQELERLGRSLVK